VKTDTFRYQHQNLRIRSANGSLLSLIVSKAVDDEVVSAPWCARCWQVRTCEDNVAICCNSSTRSCHSFNLVELCLQLYWTGSSRACPVKSKAELPPASWMPWQRWNLQIKLIHVNVTEEWDRDDSGCDIIRYNENWAACKVQQHIHIYSHRFLASCIPKISQLATN
jgi:hypothetical protein